MIAYHISRSDSLQIGQTINLMNDDSQMSNCLFDGKVSYHGRHYLEDCCIESLSSHIIENEVELVRQRFFPNLLSRYQSFFALKNIEDLVYWPELLWPNFKIYEIEFFHGNFHEHDASYLNYGPNINVNPCWSPQKIFTSALQYWNGEFSQTPKPELLVLPPVTIKTEKHLSIGLI